MQTWVSANVPAAVRGRALGVTELGWALSLAVTVALAVAAGESVLIVYGRWLTTDFNLSVAQIGVSTLAIVAAELCGEGLVVVVADHLGLCRTLFSALAAIVLWLGSRPGATGTG